jgi:predicted transcriptional regulator
MPKSLRTTISLPADHYRDVMRIARDQHVSTAWVRRDALRAYLAARYPLFERDEGAARSVQRVGGAAKKNKL